MIEVLEGMPDGVVGVEATGEVFADDYERVALVTSVDWMRHLTHAFSWLAPNGMKVSPSAELDAAKTWAAG